MAEKICPCGRFDTGADLKLCNAHSAALNAGDAAQEKSYAKLDKLSLSDTKHDRAAQIHAIWSAAFDKEMNRRGYFSDVPSVGLSTPKFYANKWTKGKRAPARQVK